MIPACKLWEKTSAKGNRYLIGRMGGVRVMVLENTSMSGRKDTARRWAAADAARRLDEAHKLLDEIADMLTHMRRTLLGSGRQR